MEEIKRTKVALDTNMLLAIGKLKIDVFSQIKGLKGKIEFVVPKQVRDELKELKEKGARLRRDAELAEKLMEENKVKEVIVEAKNADQALEKLSEEYFVASNDKELLKKIRGKKIFIKQKKFIKIE